MTQGSYDSPAKKKNFKNKKKIKNGLSRAPHTANFRQN